jgi:hypothetical protein
MDNELQSNLDVFFKAVKDIPAKSLDDLKAKACMDAMQMVIGRANTLGIKPNGGNLLQLMDALQVIFTTDNGCPYALRGLECRNTGADGICRCRKQTR